MEALIEFVRRNWLLALVVVLLAVFAPSVLGGIFRVLLWVVLGFVVLAAAASLILRSAVRRAAASAEKPRRKEEEVHVDASAQVPSHREVGDYVAFEEIVEDEK